MLCKCFVLNRLCVVQKTFSLTHQTFEWLPSTRQAPKPVNKIPTNEKWQTSNINTFVQIKITIKIMCVFLNSSPYASLSWQFCLQVYSPSIRGCRYRTSSWCSADKPRQTSSCSNVTEQCYMRAWRTIVLLMARPGYKLNKLRSVSVWAYLSRVKKVKLFISEERVFLFARATPSAERRQFTHPSFLHQPPR